MKERSPNAGFLAVYFQVTHRKHLKYLLFKKFSLKEIKIQRL